MKILIKNFLGNTFTGTLRTNQGDCILFSKKSPPKPPTKPPTKPPIRPPSKPPLPIPGRQIPGKEDFSPPPPPPTPPKK